MKLPTEYDPRCICGHLINKSHTINIKKTIKDKNKIHAKCNFCNCKELCMD